MSSSPLQNKSTLSSLVPVQWGPLICPWPIQYEPTTCVEREREKERQRGRERDIERGSKRKRVRCTLKICTLVLFSYQHKTQRMGQCIFSKSISKKECPRLCCITHFLWLHRPISLPLSLSLSPASSAQSLYSLQFSLRSPHLSISLSSSLSPLFMRCRLCNACCTVQILRMEESCAATTTNTTTTTATTNATTTAATTTVAATAAERAPKERPDGEPMRGELTF